MDICLVFLTVLLTNVSATDQPTYHERSASQPGAVAWVNLDEGADHLRTAFPCRGDTYTVWVTAGAAATEPITITTPEGEVLPELSQEHFVTLPLIGASIYFPIAAQD